eukprot:scaffold32807_cov18-Tisochrysis_lutea.AAC.1
MLQTQQAFAHALPCWRTLPRLATYGRRIHKKRRKSWAKWLLLGDFLWYFSIAAPFDINASLACSMHLCCELCATTDVHTFYPCSVCRYEIDTIESLQSTFDDAVFASELLEASEVREQSKLYTTLCCVFNFAPPVPFRFSSFMDYSSWQPQLQQLAHLNVGTAQDKKEQLEIMSEAQSLLEKLEGRLDQWETRKLLNGLYDD